MISIRINGEEREYGGGIESWINDQINRRRSHGAAACVEVNVRFAALNLVLHTPGCISSSATSRRPPTAAEQQIFDLWRSLGLNEPTYTGGQVIAFLKQLRRNT